MSKVTYRSYFRVLGSRFVFGVRGSVLPFRVRSSAVAALIVLATMATGCAAKGGSVATPRPFPGASVPAASAPPASGPAEVAAAASPAEGVQLPLLSLALSL